jgi:hypothetical protein
MSYPSGENGRVEKKEHSRTEEQTPAANCHAAPEPSEPGTAMAIDCDTFACAFSDGSAVRAQIDLWSFDERTDLAGLVHLQWNQTPDREIIPEYLRWVHGVMSHLAQRAQKRIIYLFNHGEPGPVYDYQADGRYQRINRRRRRKEDQP